MNILAIDTAGKTAAVAVMRDDTLLYEMASNTGLTHSETLLPMVDTALKACGLTPAQLDLYAVTNGPGSFYRAAHRSCRRQGAGFCGQHPLRRGFHHGCPGLRRVRGRHCDWRTGRPPRPGVLGRV